MKAFTLVEIIVAVVVGLLVMSGVFMLTGLGRNARVYTERLDGIAAVATLTELLKNDLVCATTAPGNLPFAVTSSSITIFRLGPGGTERVLWQVHNCGDGRALLVERNGHPLQNAQLSSFSARLIDEGDIAAVVVDVKPWRGKAQKGRRAGGIESHSIFHLFNRYGGM